MTTNPLSLGQPMLIEVAGSDAVKIVHNLTTNQVQSLEPGSSVESFITDVRGWVVAHGLVLRYEPECWWILGQHPKPESVAAHVDRYIIREDAQVIDRSDAVLLSLSLESPSGPSVEITDVTTILFSAISPTARLHVGHASSLPIKSEQLLPESIQMDGQDAYPAVESQGAGSMAWDRIRIPRGWPIMGRDIWEKCIPQELDRTEQAINFTKGCYLGQETIARLDALGQIQKKLSVLRVDTVGLQPETPVFSSDKQVGTITSAATHENSTMALAVLRRGFFEPGTLLTCNNAAAQVLSIR